MKMAVPEVITLVRKFLKEETGSDNPKFTSVESIEPDSKWKVLVDVGDVAVIRREIIVDDRDGKIVSYRQV
jgi:hypothetical protein